MQTVLPSVILSISSLIPGKVGTVLKWKLTEKAYSVNLLLLKNQFPVLYIDHTCI